MLAGHPFVGKSMLVAGLLAAIEEGEPFLGRQTRAATAVLVSEEDETALRTRAGLFGLLETGSEYCCRNSGVLSCGWEELIYLATDHALNGGHGLLVVDTFPGLAGLGDEQENDAGAIAKRLRPLQEAAGRGLSVLFLHHMNSGGKPRGSKAFRGVVDTSVCFYRTKTSNTVTLRSESRFPTVPDSLKAKLIEAPDGWFYQPSPPTSRNRRRRRRARLAPTSCC